MSKYDQLAIILSIIGVILAGLVAVFIYEGLPHIEDEIAFVWQAEILAKGDIKIQSPPEPDSFLVPFVVDHDGYRFSKYPLGWPAVLSLGVLLDIRSWINPILAGLGIWLTYLIGKRVLGEKAGIIASALTLTSPFFLMISGSLLSHSLSLVLSLVFVLAWLNMYKNQDSIPRTRDIVMGGISLGYLTATRPLTAVAVGLPFAIHTIIRLVIYLNYSRTQKSYQQLIKFTKALLLLMVILAVFVGLHLLWQYYVTGNPFQNPYTLWWEYDRIGFGKGFGALETGHSLKKAFTSLSFSLQSGFPDLFGWAMISLIFVPFGLIMAFKKRRLFLPASIFFSLVLVYLAYWVGSWLYGPRYFYEGLFSLTLLTAGGVVWLGGWVGNKPGNRFRRSAVTFLVGILVASNLVFYLPARLQGMHNLYGINRQNLQPFSQEEAESLTPALIIVHPSKSWQEYGNLLELEDPYLTTPFIFVYYRGPKSTQRLASHFPDRNIYHYYPEDPYTFFAPSK